MNRKTEMTDEAVKAIINTSFLKSNIIDKEECQLQIKEVLNNIAKQVGNSLGLYGSTTIIQDQNTVERNHYITKDGYTILKEMNYFYDIGSVVLDIVKKISKSLVYTVGDGSTSAVIVANAIFNRMEKIISTTGLSSKEIIEIFNEISIILEKEIRKISKPITDDNMFEVLSKIASVANNNDDKAGDLIASIFKEIGRYSFINLIDGKEKEDTYEIVQGFNIKSGYINSRMANLDDKFSFRYNSVFVFMCNDILDDFDMENIIHLIESFNASVAKADLRNATLLFLSKSFSSSFKAFFDVNLQAKTFKNNVIAVEIDCTSVEGKKRFNDLAIALDCTIYDKFNRNDDLSKFDINSLGFCEEISGNDININFISCVGVEEQKEKVINRINELEEEYKNLINRNKSSNMDYDKELFNIKVRISMLKNSVATLYVGGDSEIEIKSRRFLIEDSVFACRSALEYGYIIGGNLIIPLIIKENLISISERLTKNKKFNYMRSFFKENFEEIKEDNEYCNINDYITHSIFSYILVEIAESFMESFKLVLSNANIKEEKIQEIKNLCLKNKSIYNLKTRNFEKFEDSSIINSAETDIQIMKSCFSIISLLATSNQFLMVNAISNKARY